MTYPLPIPVTLGAHGEVKYERRVVKHELTIDKRNFKICEPKEIRKRHHVVSERVYVVHVKPNGKVTIREIR